MEQVKFLNPQGKEETRPIADPAQISGFTKAGFKVIDNPYATPVPAPVTPVSSTTDLRNGESMVKAQANEGLKSLQSFDETTSGLINSISNFQPYSQTEAGKTANTELEKMRKSLGIITPEEQKQITQAGVSEGMKYDPLIQEAEAGKKKGLPKAVISGGERGGFMNTQIAGSAALAQTEGGDWVGAGGELESIQSVYDQNIQNAKSAKLQAISAAEAAARQAIKTGKESDYKLFQDAFDRSQQMSMQELELANEKVKAVSNYEQMVTARISTALEEMSTISSAGGVIPEDLKTLVNSKYGEGFTDKYEEVLKAQSEALDAEGEMKTAKTLVDILSKVPDGQTMKIGETEYTGMKETDPKKGLYSFTETNSAGVVTQVVTRLNPETNKMEIVGTLNLGAIGKPKSSGGGGGGDTEEDGYDYAIELLSLNPEATDEDLIVQLQRDTKLGQSEINALIANREAYNKEVTSSGVSGSW